MKQIKSFIALLFFVLTPLAAMGQALTTGYFTKGYYQAHRLNPALTPENGYVGVAISNIGVNVASNLGAKSLFYPIGNGRIGTFLHPEVPVSTAMSGFDEISFVSAMVNIDLLNLGFRIADNGYLTIDVGAEDETAVDIPKTIFSAMKEGMTSDPITYNIYDISVFESLYGHITAGYSYDFSDVVPGLKVGAKAKFLLPVVMAKVAIDRANLTMGSNKWVLDCRVSGTVSGTEPERDESGKVVGVDPREGIAGVTGFGVGFDLGASYSFEEGSPLDGLTISAAATDLGFIKYSKDNTFEVSSVGVSEYDGVHDIDFSRGFTADFKATFSDMLGFGQLSAIPAMSVRNRLTSKIRVGADYAFFDKKMSVGALFTNYNGDRAKYNELSFIYNYHPVNWFSAALSYSVLNTLSSFGFMVNFSPNRGVNFFLGCDYVPLWVTPQMLPVNKAFMSIQTGLSIPIGGRK